MPPRVLVFDSGVGGLSILEAARARMPGLDIVYAADDAGFPYGLKPDAELATRVPALLGRLVERFRPDLAVIACNTASLVAIGPARTALGVGIVGTVPAIKPAAALTRTGVIGVLGTQLTVRLPYVDRLVAEFAADRVVLRHGAPAVVDAAEAKLRGQPVDTAALEAALAALETQPGGERMDTLVLSCTHFPLLAAEIAALRPGLRLVDSGDGIARRIGVLLGRLGLDPSGPAVPGLAVFTGGADSDALRPELARRGLPRVEVL